jgi:predicted nucleic acid-binding protein
MIVVSNTSPLNYLVMIQQVDVLPAIFDRVVAPPAVIRELLHPGAPDAVRVWAASPPIWLQVVSPLFVDDSFGLGRGEAEAIGLAQEINADTLLIDERKALLVAQALGLNVTGTIGVLELAATRNLLDLPAAISALRKTTFRCSEKLFDEAIRRHEQRRLE